MNNKKQAENKIRKYLSVYGKGELSYFDIAKKFDLDIHYTSRKQCGERVRSIFRSVNRNNNNIKPVPALPVNDPMDYLDGITDSTLISEFKKWFDSKKNKKKVTYDFSKLPKPFTTGDPDNVLVIGDLHEPFSIKGYLEFCRQEQERYNCGTVVFIGDIVDSYHDSMWDIDKDISFTAGEERENSKKRIQEWAYVFPIATVLTGNHDQRVSRKAMKNGISTDYLKSWNEILEISDEAWEFLYEKEINGVLYRHGDSGHAFLRCQKERQSVVQGHFHTLGYVQWNTSRRDSIFGMQVGCGIDAEAEAFEYGKRYAKRPIIGCGVVLDSGSNPHFIKRKDV